MITRRRASGGLLAVVAALVAAVALAYAVPLPARLSERGSPVIRYADGTVAHVFLAPDDRWRIDADLDRVDPRYVDALVRAEDRRFWWHPGVDPLAIARAAAMDLRAGEVVSGGSTLTMQLVRMVEPRPRTLTSKVIEVFRAMQLELRMTKPEILEAYLTFAPYGRNVEGVEAASLAYFGHSADALDADEIAVLLAVPQDPTDRYPRPDHDAALGVARDRVARRLGLRTTGRVVPDALIPLPSDAPHASAWLSGRAERDGDVSTTLDRTTQSLVERLVRAEQPRAEQDGIHNVAVVVVDHATGEIRALIGGFDFWDTDHGGQIAAFDVPRSPGSALKPFIYALSIDRGLVLPEQLVPDVPMRWGSYAPQNFDGQFSGLVRMEDALSRSLNIPFIALLSRLGTEPLLGDLRALGASHLDDRPGHYGLSVAAGGIELTPMEMAGLFAALAENGVPRPPRLIAGDPPADEPPVFSAGAAWLTRRALSIRDRPDFPARRRIGDTPRSIHWKTGTSYGWRDAWAIGSGPRDTVAVWMGNLDNSGSTHLIGAEASGPLLFDVLEALGDLQEGHEDPIPPDLTPVQVCAMSGHRPGDACPDRVSALALTARSPQTTCPYHVNVEIDAATGLRVAPGCVGDRPIREETAVVWPTSVRRWLVATWRQQPTTPPWAPGCAPAEGQPPEIVSPTADRQVLLVPGVPAASQAVPLEADASGDAELSWFVDGELVGSALPHERVWWEPSLGRHDLVVMDATGASASLHLTVRAP